MHVNTMLARSGTGAHAAALMLCLALAGCKVDLYSSLTEQEANEMLAALASQQISASKELAGESGWQLQVEERSLGAALEALRMRGLPHDRFVSLGDMFQKQGLVSTPAEERMRYIYGLSQELSRTLQTIDGVMAARVHVVIPAADPLSDKVKPSSAAVFIKHTADADLRTLVPTVKDMVAHSIEGLSHDQVSLTLYEGRTRAAGASPALDDARREPNFFATLPASGQWGLIVVAGLALAALSSLPYLLRREQTDWRTWLRRVWPRS
jgi:type III secretion protein J